MAELVEVVVGAVGRAHGLRGEVAIELRTDEPDRRFAQKKVLRAEGDGRLFTVTSARYHSGRLLVTFAELTDRTAAEVARGTRLVVEVPADELPGSDGEFYDRQLVGLRVLDAAGADVGAVSAVVHLPAQDALEVLTDGGPRLVPFVTALVPEVDLGAGHVQLADVPGLLKDAEDS
ncbi:MAG TPA: ribosome maturation factor RimM [Propionibacteriaceae bacterium]|nr:ribosome maturation factor RimM [Propionibacteriaceae bacterium]